MSDVTFEMVTDAIQSGASTLREIADRLGVPLRNPDFWAALNFMRHQRRIDFAGGCCTDSLEHSLDCEVTVL